MKYTFKQIMDNYKNARENIRSVMLLMINNDFPGAQELLENMKKERDKHQKLMDDYFNDQTRRKSHA